MSAPIRSGPIFPFLESTSNDIIAVNGKGLLFEFDFIVVNIMKGYDNYNPHNRVMALLGLGTSAET